MKFPIWTLLICSLSTVIFFVPAIGSVLIYDRQSILAGEWWRLITGNLVHLSMMHFLYDVLALLVVGTITELRGDKYLWLVYLASGTAIGVIVYMTLPELRFFGGLSGIVTAAMVYLCLNGLRDSGYRSWLWLFALIIVVTKIGIESMFGMSLLSASAKQPFVPVPESHLVGACMALLVYLLQNLHEQFISVLLLHKLDDHKL
jgi:rhomboid family GlyGly-CTERM serine protease